MRGSAPTASACTCPNAATPSPCTAVDNQVITVGDLPSVVALMAELHRNAGPPQPGPEWQQLIDDYLPTLVAAGQPATTLNLRRTQLEKMARQVGGTPARVDRRPADRVAGRPGLGD